MQERPGNRVAWTSKQNQPNCYLKQTKTTSVIFLSSVSPSVRGILRLTLRLKNNPWQQCKTSRILQENHRLGNNAWKIIHMGWRHTFPFLVSVLLHNFEFLSNCIAAPWLSVTMDFQWIKHIVKNLAFIRYFKKLLAIISLLKPYVSPSLVCVLFLSLYTTLSPKSDIKCGLF